MTITEIARSMKLAAPLMAASTNDIRVAALKSIAKALEDNKTSIFEANAIDLKNAKDNGISDAVYKRLKFDEGKLKSVLDGIDQLVSLPDPVGKTMLKRQLDDGLILESVSCPIGVIGVIFEARPDALVQISTLCIKSGNCAILKGGKETANTNQALFEVIKKSIIDAGLPGDCLFKAEQHNEIDELLECDKYVDLLIPRGSNAFVQYIMNNTKIPVMGHADGVCHVYVDKDADIDKAIRIVVDAKTQYTAACNAAETLLVDRKIAESFLPKAYEALSNANVKLRGNEEVTKLIKVESMNDDEYNTEYLDLVMSVKLVDGVEEAVDHINRFGSHHTDAIISENDKTAAYFMQMVDSAGVYQNASTRFADGFRYGFGAEVGISTSKLHARGPVGLEGLMTYKYKLYGSGQIVEDYSNGSSSFHFQDL
ncbi:MAG: glutamate-5-semialdehyde dehydrogenase [Lachnospiraceae bacterium]|nr:glutamate-5-semialdehyde dehydrogenase [Lachnospiraceae bacterium]